MESRPWANLPSEILSQIASKRSSDAAVYVSLRRICREWCQSLTRESPVPPLPSPQLPFLLVPPRTIANHTVGKIFPLPVFNHFTTPKLIDDLPQLANSINSFCVGTSHGWLITLGKDSSVSLLNPVTADSIPLKPLSSIDNKILSFNPNSYPEYYLMTREKARIANFQHTLVRLSILSSDPAQDNDFTLLLFLTGLKDCCFTLKGRDGAWTSHLHGPTEVKDVIFIRGVFFTLSPPLQLGIFDFRNIEAGLAVKVCNLNLNMPIGDTFLVNSNNIPLIVHTYPLNNQRLFMPRRYIQGMQYIDNFNPDDSQVRGRFTRELNGVVLFLGHGCSVAVSLDHFPWLMENAIYYTLVRIEMQRVEGEDERMISLWQGTIFRNIIKDGYCVDSNKLFNVEQCRANDFWLFPRPFWVTPNIRRVHVV